MVIKRFLLFFFIISLYSCSNLEYRINKKENIVRKSEFKQIVNNFISDFNTEVWLRRHNVNSKHFVLYIEGDGKSWKTRYSMSENPTPTDPVALRLASKDSRENILYLSRPCQYSSINDSKCNETRKYWGRARYSLQIINHFDKLISSIKSQYKVTSFEIIGYSGGGVIASALAAKRKDIIKLITIASNLDHKQWTSIHQVSPLIESVDLFSMLNQLSLIKQFHFFGKKDNIVPFNLNETFFDALRSKQADNIHEFIIKDSGHQCCWADIWNNLLAKTQPNNL